MSFFWTFLFSLLIIYDTQEIGQQKYHTNAVISRIAKNCTIYVEPVEIHQLLDVLQ